MDQQSFDKLNTFGLGKWIFIPSFSNAPASFEQNKKFLCDLFKDTDVCLKDMNHTDEYLRKDNFFVFVDNYNKPQIVGNTYYGSELQNMRGVCDKQEQNIGLKYVKVANAFFNKNLQMYGVKDWKQQINWIARLQIYEYLFNHKMYSKINVKKLIDDLAYNGFSLHKEVDAHEIYYPVAKRKLLAQPMLKPMIANYLGCKTSEVQVGKYVGNGKNVKYVVGDLLSQYLHKDCQIKKVFGSVKIKNYIGDFDYIYDILATNGFSFSAKNNIAVKSRLFDGEYVSQK